jgi:23S rRNA pseudouridine2605 synthase
MATRAPKPKKRAMAERLQKILARAGFGSRRECEKFIRAGRVTVDGKTAELGMSVEPALVQIRVDGSPITLPEEHVYIVMNKPPQVLSSLRSQGGFPTVVDLVQVDRRVYPVGRLDLESEGLILLTDDGELTNRLTHPRYEHEKEYIVLLDRRPSRAEVTAWRNGVHLRDGEKTKPAKVSVVDAEAGQPRVRVVMKEGRKRQIRETAQSLGLQVKRLIRVRMGPLSLGNLEVGEWRHATPQEREALMAIKGSK